MLSFTSKKYYLLTFLTSLILSNILVALFSDAYSSIVGSADEQYQAYFAQKVVGLTRAPDEFVFVPPFNLVEILLVVPLGKALELGSWLRGGARNSNRITSGHQGARREQQQQQEKRSAYERLNRLVQVVLFGLPLTLVAWYESGWDAKEQRRRRRLERMRLRYAPDASTADENDAAAGSGGAARRKRDADGDAQDELEAERQEERKTLRWLVSERGLSADQEAAVQEGQGGTLEDPTAEEEAAPHSQGTHGTAKGSSTAAAQDDASAQEGRTSERTLSRTPFARIVQLLEPHLSHIDRDQHQHQSRASEKHEQSEKEEKEDKETKRASKETGGEGQEEQSTAKLLRELMREVRELRSEVASLRGGGSGAGASVAASGAKKEDA